MTTAKACSVCFALTPSTSPASTIGSECKKHVQYAELVCELFAHVSISDRSSVSRKLQSRSKPNHWNLLTSRQTLQISRQTLQLLRQLLQPQLWKLPLVSLPALGDVFHPHQWKLTASSWKLPAPLQTRLGVSRRLRLQATSWVCLGVRLQCQERFAESGDLINRNGSLQNQHGHALRTGLRRIVKTSEVCRCGFIRGQAVKERCQSGVWDLRC
mmetsp:Transcript_157030/g.301286  ORF Transcript_157030/g.301286 Transcript_157030/m.301286 type:complete len:214 (+) Transcript_157030:669-1310(+)